MSWSGIENNIYSRLGFRLDSISEPGFVWCKGGIVKSRHQMRKHKTGMSEKELYSNGWQKIWMGIVYILYILYVIKI